MAETDGDARADRIPPLIGVAVLLIFLGAIFLTIQLRSTFHHEAAEVVAEAERTVIRHDLDHGAGE